MSIIKRKITGLCALAVAVVVAFTGCGGSKGGITGESNSTKEPSEPKSGVSSTSSSKTSGIPTLVDVERYVKVPVFSFIDKEYKVGDPFNQIVYGEYYYNAIDEGKDLYGGTRLKVGVSEFIKGMKFDSFYDDMTLSSVPYQVIIQRGYDFREEYAKSPVEGEEEFRRTLNENYDAETASYLYNLYSGVSTFTGKYCDEEGYNKEELTGYCYVDGTKLVAFIGDEPTFNPEEGIILEYDLSVGDDGLHLSRNGVGTTLIFSYFSKIALQTKGELGNRLSISGYASGKNQVCNGISMIHFSDTLDTSFVYFDDGGKAVNPEIMISDDRRTMSVSWEDEEHPDEKGINRSTGQSGSLNVKLINFGNYQSTSGVGGFTIEQDGRYYVYGIDRDEYLNMKLSSMEVGELSDTQAEELLRTKSAILKALADKFNEVGIEAVIDEMTGNIYLDANVLFAVESSDINEQGKDLLSRFIEAYTSVIMDDNFKDSIDSLIVEGHTDTNGSYEHNLELSEKRAASVGTYCKELNPALDSYIIEKGYSYNNPIYNEDGSINMEASRRVVFNFALRIN